MANLKEEVTHNYITATRMVLEQLKQTSFAQETKVTINLDDDIELKHTVAFLCESLIEIADDLLEE